MKNRKKALVAFVLCSAMLMGVGYAALTTVLTLDGTAYIKTDAAQDEFAGDVILKSVAAASPLDTASIDAGSDNMVATFDVNSLGLAGDTAVFTVVVESQSQFAATMGIKSVTVENQALTPSTTGLTTTASSETLDVTCVWDTVNLAAGDTEAQQAVLTVTLKLNNTPQSNADYTFQIELEATSVEG